MIYQLNEENAKSEFDLLKRIYEDYKKDPWSTIGLQIITPSGIFINKGGFNGNPSDLWLYKKGTLGQTKKTFWRTGIGSKRAGGFQVFVYNLRFATVTPENIYETAELIGARLKGNDLMYFY